MADVEHLIGATVQGWLLTDCVGRGADGIVYAGQKGDATAAIKLFFPGPLKKNGIASARERLEMQLSLVGETHPNLVRIYEGGEETSLDTLFLVMELVPGTSLDKCIGNIPPGKVPSLVKQLASAAERLEALELVHRDIKPANIVLSDDFEKLTLLDLGIVHHVPPDDDQGQLSGMEFVATLRYSPPEFVYREEDREADGAWRAVTFYQIGATMHDLIMGKILFADHDTPRSHLYDAVRYRTPVIESEHIEDWLLKTAQACLLKEWRKRLQFVSWASFSEPHPATDAQQHENRIRLRQIRNEEFRQASAKHPAKGQGPTREQQLWQMNAGTIHEVRTYLFNSLIFPKCDVLEEQLSLREYQTRFLFDRNDSLGFPSGVVFTLGLNIDVMAEEATKLSFKAEVGEQIISTATWTEMFTVESAFNSCRQSFLGAVDLMLSNQ